MKYLKYNEELFNFGKTKLVLPNDVIIYIDNDIYKKNDLTKFKDTKEFESFLNSILDIVNLDLGGGWKIEKSYVYKGNDEIRINLSKGNIKMSISHDYPKPYKEGVNKFSYKIYIDNLDVSSISPRDFDQFGVQKSYNEITLKKGEIEYSTEIPVKRSKLKIPNNIPEIEKFISDKKEEMDKKRELTRIKQQEEYKKKKEEEERMNSKLKDVKNSFPSLLNEIKDILLDLTDLTSFSDVKYFDTKNMPNISYSLENFKYYLLKVPICVVNIHLDGLIKGDTIKPKSLESWDYLSNILKKVKQIDSYLVTLNNEYFNNTGLKLELDLSNTWTLTIRVIEIGGTNKYNRGKRVNYRPFSDDEFFEDEDEY